MSYEIVKTLSVKQNEQNKWYAKVVSACNNCYPHYYSAWDYGFFDTKEELQKSLLLDFFHGNFHGGTSTKYGQFIKSLGGWGSKQDNGSYVCKIHRFYDDIIYGSLYGNKYKDVDRKICSKLSIRRDRELKRYLYKEFQQFSNTHKPCKLRIWSYNKYLDNWVAGAYLHTYYKQRKGAYFTTSYENATVYNKTSKIGYLTKLAEQNGYRVEKIYI